MARAARLIAHGAPVEVHDVDLPPPGADEVLVQLEYGGVNPVDRYGAEGRVAADGPLPRTLGAEASGFLEGKPVLVAGEGLGSVRDGVWATAAVVPRTAVFELPGGVDLAPAAGMGIVGLTAWNVVHLASIGPADRVLVLGAAGGVGLPAVSLAAASGATVWGQTGHAAKADAIRAAGAANAIVSDGDTLVAALGTFAPTVVIDPLGGSFTGAAMTAMAPHGRLVLLGTSAGTEATIQLQQLYRNGLWVLGYAGLRLTREQRRLAMPAALEAFADGRLRVPVGRELPLDDVNDAFRVLVDRAVTGKVVLRLR